MQSLPRKWLVSCAFVLVLCPVISQAAWVPFHFGNSLFQRMQSDFGESASQRLLDWKAFMEEVKSLPEPQRVQAVNAYVNGIPFVADQAHWARNDYWATPFEFFASNGGDCEDFAIAKYYTLLSSGVPESRLRLTYVRTDSASEAHMVLTYQPSWSAEADAWVLDNQVQEVTPLRERKELTPVYSFNGSGFWVVQSDGQAVLSGRSQDVVMWRELDSRLKTLALL